MGKWLSGTPMAENLGVEIVDLCQTAGSIIAGSKNYWTLKTAETAGSGNCWEHDCWEQKLLGARLLGAEYVGSGN
jgi:hypothetical protein